MDLCPESTIIPFDVAATAGYYSQLTGVLAGFSFTALIFLISIRFDNSSNTQTGPVKIGEALAPAYMALIASFIGLILCSLGYAVYAGSKVAAGRAASEMSVQGVGFALSGPLLVFAIILTLDGLDHASSANSPQRQHVALVTRNIVAMIVAPMAVLYILLGIEDYLRSRHGEGYQTAFLVWYSWILVLIQLIASWTLYPFWSKRHSRKPRSGWVPTKANHAVQTLSVSFLIITAASDVATSLIESQTDLCLTLHPLVPGAAITVVFGAMMWLTWLLAHTRPVWDDDVVDRQVKP